MFGKKDKRTPAEKDAAEKAAVAKAESFLTPNFGPN
jgi:hypothetical protein